MTVSQRKTVAQRRNHQISAQRKNLGNHKNRTVGWASEALDLYLEGFSPRDISDHFEIKNTSQLYHVMAREALLRLMEAKQVERLEEVAELEKDIES